MENRQRKRESSGRLQYTVCNFQNVIDGWKSVLRNSLRRQSKIVETERGKEEAGAGGSTLRKVWPELPKRDPRMRRCYEELARNTSQKFQRETAGRPEEGTLPWHRRAVSE